VKSDCSAVSHARYFFHSMHPSYANLAGLQHKQVADAMARSAREAAAPPPPRRIKQLEDDGDEDDEALVCSRGRCPLASLLFFFFNLLENVATQH